MAGRQPLQEGLLVGVAGTPSYEAARCEQGSQAVNAATHVPTIDTAASPAGSCHHLARGCTGSIREQAGLACGVVPSVGCRAAAGAGRCFNIDITTASHRCCDHLGWCRLQVVDIAEGGTCGALADAANSCFSVCRTGALRMCVYCCSACQHVSSFSMRGVVLVVL